MSRQAIIFDLDGVLIDSAQAHLESWKQLAHELRHPFDEKRFLETFGRRNEEVIPSLFGPGRSPNVTRELSVRKEQIYRDLIRGRVPAIDGAVDLVRACADDGFAVALGSSAPRENAELVLEELGIRDCFGALVTDRDVPRGKPDPSVFLTAAERLAVTPRRCVVTEDAPAGIKAAKAADMTAVALVGAHARDTLLEADLIVGSLRELTPDRLRELIER